MDCKMKLTQSCTVSVRTIEKDGGPVIPPQPTRLVITDVTITSCNLSHSYILEDCCVLMFYLMKVFNMYVNGCGYVRTYFMFSSVCKITENTRTLWPNGKLVKFYLKCGNKTYFNLHVD